MKKLLTSLFFLIIVSSINLFAIERITSNEIPGIKLPANPLVGPAGKNVPSPKLNGVQPVYILFDNLEDPISSQISNYINLMYYDSLYKVYPSYDNNYLTYMVRAPFNDATLSQYNLTDFDVAIFPIGDYPLNYATAGGIKIIDKIKDMLDAGKRVMVMGRYWVSWAFNPSSTFNQGKDPVVIDFLTNTLGINKDSSGLVQVASGNTYIPFHIEGIDADPVSKGYDYYCNVGYGRNVPPQMPLVLRPYLDVFKLIPSSTANGFSYLDKVGPVDEQPNVPKGFWVGAKAQVGDGKIAIWSLCPDVIALPESEFYTWSEKYAMDWFTKDIAHPEPWLEFESTMIDWGETLLDNTKIKEIRYRNFGKKPLIITNISWEGWTDNGIFTILEGGETGTLQPNEFKTIKVGFKPNAEGEFQDNLNFTSNAANGTNTAVSCRGIGGKDAPIGPEITVQSDPFDFGTLDIGVSLIKDVYFESSGTAPLIVNNIEFVQNDDVCFSFPKQMNYPITIPAGDKSIFQLRFNPTTYGKKYTAKLKITSNAKVNPVAYLLATGAAKSAAEGAVISSSIDTLDFGNVKALNGITKSFKILNTGLQNLKIQLFYMNDENDVFSVPSSIIDNTPVEIKPTNSLEIPVTFKPWENGPTYLANLGMFTNAANEGGNDFHVYFKGVGDVNGQSVKEEVQNTAGTLKLKAFPNPAGNDFTLEVTSKRAFFNASLNIYDLKGKIVSTIYKGNIEIGTKDYLLNNSQLASGQYFVGIQTATDSVILPLIIVK